jgi:hypothetical protein
MLLYVFWASLCLGLMKLSADTQWQEQKCKAQHAIKHRHKLPPN